MAIKNRFSAFVLIGFVAFVLITIYFGSKGKPETTNQTNINSVNTVSNAASPSPVIKKASNSPSGNYKLLADAGDFAIYEIPIRENAFDWAYVHGAGSEAKVIGEKIKTGSLPTNKKTLVLHFTTLGNDKYGNESQLRFLSLSYNIADLKLVNYENIDAWGMLNLSENSMAKGFGGELVANYCSKKENAEYATKFCNQTLTSVIKTMNQ